MCTLGALSHGYMSHENWAMNSTPENPDPTSPNPTSPDPTELIADQTGPAQAGAGPVPGEWQAASSATPTSPVEPPEGWQAGYIKAHKRAQGFMIATIVLGITTLLASLLALGVGTAMAVRTVADNQDGHSRMDSGRDGDGSNEMRGYGNNGNGNGSNNGNSQRGNRMPQTPTPTATPTPSAPATVTPTPTS